MVSKQQSNGTTEIEPRIDWTNVLTWEDAVASCPSIAMSSHAFGDGSVFITNKDELMDKGEFLILDWREVMDPVTGNTYLNILVINRANQKARFNDGSSGIMRQLLDWQEKNGGKIVQAVCQNVRKSSYVTEIDGKNVSATTYYLV